MNKNIFAAIGFTAGAAIGSVMTWFVAKKHYEQITNEEIESVKEAFASYRMPEAEPMTEEEYEEVTDISEEEDNAPTDYTSYAAKQDEPEEEEVKTVKYVKPDDTEKPYVIPPAEYGEFDDYQLITLTFYKDHIVADDENDILENIDETISFESLNHFGEYDDSAVYVRNDKMMSDYEILLDERTYQEALDAKPIRKGVL